MSLPSLPPAPLTTACNLISPLLDFTANEQGNTSIAILLNDTWWNAFRTGTLSSTSKSQLYCSINSDTCLGICPNADVSGVGVRAAFYLNAILTALLVGLSPDDSPSAAWSSALLTMSLIIPAMIQKKQGQLTLYHATLVMNFATFSSVSSLAVAPLCTVWRYIDNKEHPDYAGNHQPHLPTSHPGTPQRNTPPEDPDSNSIVATATRRQRARVILSFALIAQVSLQWTWATYLFTSPFYSQMACSPCTVVVLFFGRQRTAQTINDHDFALWASWLLFHIAISLFFGILMVISSTSGANIDGYPRKSLRKPKKHLISDWLHNWDEKGQKRRMLIFALAAAICLMLVIDSENQVNYNHVSDENSQWGFGQIAALLFALAPVWGIAESKRAHEYTKVASEFLKAFLSRTKVPVDGEPEPPQTPSPQSLQNDTHSSRVPLLMETSPSHTPTHSPDPTDYDYSPFHGPYQLPDFEMRPDHSRSHSLESLETDVTLAPRLRLGRLRSRSVSEASSSKISEELRIPSDSGLPRIRVVSPTVPPSRASTPNVSQVDLSRSHTLPPNFLGPQFGRFKF